MNNKQLAHIWANKSRSSAKGSHFYFEGDTIYSYGPHFPIARHHRGVVLLTTERHSVSTARHISHTRQAVSHMQVFTVGNVLANPCREHVREYTARVASAALTLARAKNPEWPLQQLQSLVTEANAFCTLFKFKTRFQMPNESTLAGYKEKVRLATVKAAAQTKARAAKLEKANAETIAKWLAGESVSVPYGVSKVYLRANACYRAGVKSELPSDGVLQTSKGAEVPMCEAEKAFRFCIAHKAIGWHRNGSTFAVGDFQLDAVNEQGVVAGCHRIAWPEIEAFAKSQGWTD